MFRFLPLILASGLLVAGTPTAHAGPGAKAAEKVRAALAEPSTERGLAFAGDLWEGGDWKGSLRVTVEATALDERMVWTSKEELRWSGGASDCHLTVTLTLARDLSVERVELSRKEGAREVLAFLTREGEALTGTSRTITGEEEGAGTPLRVAWPKTATGGLGGVALLARAHLTPGQEALELGWIPTQLWSEAQPPAQRTLTLAAPEAGEGDGSLLALTVVPGLASGGAGTATSMLHLTTAADGVLGWTSVVGSADLLPIGALPQAARFDESKPARAWQHAFRTFGVGYHMAKPELLERAFDWQALYDYETSIEDGWPASRPLSVFKQAWMDEFLTQSKHRNRQETDELLAGTLGTGTLTVRSPDHVVLAAIAQFGGGTARTYQLKRGPDGIWRMTRFG